MKALNYLFLCITAILAVFMGIFYYVPTAFASGFLRNMSDIANNSYRNTNITFALMVFFALLSVFLIIFVITEHKRRLAKKRRALTRKFDEYGTKFEHEDREIDF